MKSGPFGCLNKISTSLALGLALACAHPPAQDTVDPQPPDTLSSAFATLVATLEEVESDIRQSPSFGSEAEQVGAYRHILRGFAKGMEAEILQDADFPFFRILDFWLREGGDNPDQRYAFTPIRGGETLLTGDAGNVALASARVGMGRVVVCTLGTSFVDTRMGRSDSTVPDAALRHRFSLLYGLVRGVVEGDGRRNLLHYGVPSAAALAADRSETDGD